MARIFSTPQYLCFCVSQGPSNSDSQLGPRIRSAAVDITPDKATYVLGQDVSLHMAVENFGAEGTVRAWDPPLDPWFAISIQVFDEHGNAVAAAGLFA